MPKTKSSKTEQAATPATPVVEKKVRAPKTPKTEAPPPSSVTETAAPTTTETDAFFTEQSANFISKLQSKH